MFNEDEFDAEFRRTQRTARGIFKFTGIMLVVMSVLSVLASVATIYALYAGAKWLLAHAG